MYYATFNCDLSIIIIFCVCSKFIPGFICPLWKYKWKILLVITGLWFVFVLLTRRFVSLVGGVNFRGIYQILEQGYFHPVSYTHLDVYKRQPLYGWK